MQFFIRVLSILFAKTNNLQRKKCSKNNIIHCRDNVGMDQLKPFCEIKVNV